ncbi:hypothetical protein [Acidiphilium acidophilum]|uniref:Uncharacterized protein n=1 Tax=Acidiphilium acidophilum TaxID=76588 RepID=A0AAW9DVH2_ACIAO|nr:hypothetical protein [Acidiphilium acidophilum]MDX5932313.1 hypothetical protein [Acidiphilium acidophilum]
MAEAGLTRFPRERVYIPVFALIEAGFAPDEAARNNHPQPSKGDCS